MPDFLVWSRNPFSPDTPLNFGQTDLRTFFYMTPIHSHTMRRTAALLLFVAVLAFGCDSGPGPNTNPMADITYTPDNPRAGNSVTFSADANDPDGSIQSYEWSTSNGAQGQGSSFSHAFPEQGDYTVSLTVTDNREGTASSTKTIDIRQRYSQVTIEAVTVEEMPFANDSGEGWDYSSGPDPFFTAYNVADETREATSGYYLDVSQSSLPLPYTETSFTIEDLSKRYAINLYDSDDNDPDFIGGVSYTFDSLVGDYPEVFTLEVEEITYEVELNWGN